MTVVAQGYDQFVQAIFTSELLNADQFRQMQELVHAIPPEPRYLAQELHERMGRLAAVKVIRPDRRDRRGVLERFEREVQSMSRLDHPNIVHAYDAGICDDGTFYLAMEYLEGTNLRRLVEAHGPLSIHDASEFARQTAWGLQHAHEHQVIHRDIKPSNLFLVTQGQVIKILDMGLSRLQDEASELTRPRVSLGTVDFEAPEQLEDARMADVRSDLYSLGCTLYYLLTGRPPFPKGTAIQRMLAHVRSEPQRVEVLRPDVPTDLAGLVRRLMAKQPSQRPQAPAEAALALTDLVESDALDHDFASGVEGVEESGQQLGKMGRRKT